MGVKRKMINKKGEFGWKNFMIAMLMFSAVFATFYIYVGEMNTTYDSDILDPAYSNTYDKLNDTKADVDEIYSNIQDGSAFTFLGAAKILLTSFASTIKVGFGAITDFSGLVIGFGNTYGIPSVISTIMINLILSSIIIVLVLVIINAIATRGTGKL